MGGNKEKTTSGGPQGRHRGLTKLVKSLTDYFERSSPSVKIYQSEAAAVALREEDRPHEDQDRAGREQEGPRSGQEGLRPHQGLDHGCAEGAQGPGRQRLPGGEEGLAALQEGQGALWPVSTAALDA